MQTYWLVDRLQTTQIHTPRHFELRYDETIATDITQTWKILRSNLKQNKPEKPSRSNCANLKMIQIKSRKPESLSRPKTLQSCWSVDRLQTIKIHMQIWIEWITQAKLHTM